MVLVLTRVTRRRWLGGMGALLLCGPAWAGRGTPYGYVRFTDERRGVAAIGRGTAMGREDDLGHDKTWFEPVGFRLELAADEATLHLVLHGPGGQTLSEWLLAGVVLGCEVDLYKRDDACSFNGPHGRLTRVQEKTGTSARRTWEVEFAFPPPGDGEALGKAAAWTW